MATDDEQKEKTRLSGRALWPVLIFIVFSFLGFTDAAYLTVVHYTGSQAACSILQGCDRVLTSQYALWGGLPVALLGAFYYGMLLSLAVIYSFTVKTVFLRLSAKLSAVGFAASLWFVYLQLFVIKALCMYCLFSAAFSTVLFSLGMYLLLARPNPTAQKTISNA